MIRVLLLVGTRPEAIKMAPLAIALQQEAHDFDTILCSTGQHRQMLDQALGAFGLAPDLDLDLMRPNQTLAALTSRILVGLDEVLGRTRPDLVVVQGDTATAMVGALAAYYHRLPVAHLEAGLRTDDLFQPFPEEGNRRLIGILAALHFPPTTFAADNLRREGVPEGRILVTGNTVIDALLHVRRRLALDLAPPAGYRRILLTMHRRENGGQPFEEICGAVLDLVQRNPDVDVLFPVHASPAVREPVQRLLGGHPRIALTEPLGYEDFVRALDASYLVLTDSGGVQEEAPALGKPVLVLRDKTERPEAIVAGTSRLVGTDRHQVLEMAERLLHDASAYGAMARAANPYGDGRASARIVGALRHHFGLADAPPEPFVAGARTDEYAGAAR
jgi:UDP-N-acetylglucosamine 2-epimerase (non-hydrolysing)